MKNYKVEGDLREEVTGNVKRLKEIGSYRGSWHKRGLLLEDREPNQIHVPRKETKDSWSIKEGGMGKDGTAKRRQQLRLNCRKKVQIKHYENK